METRLKRIYKRLCFFLAILIILAALISSFVRALTPFASQYKRQMEHHLSTLFGLPVSIQKMETGWYWFYPVVELKEVKISKNNKPLIHLNKILVGLNILDSLWQWQIQPGLLYIEGLSLTVKQSGKKFEIEGLVPSIKTTFSLDSQQIEPYLAWVFDQDKIILKELSVNFMLEQGPGIPVKHLNLSIVSSLDHYYIEGKAEIATKVPAHLHFLADLKLQFLKQFKNARGKAYLSFQNLDIAPLQNVFPDALFTKLQGVGNADFWFNINAEKIEKIQARLDLKNVAWQDKSRTSPLFNAIRANLSYALNQQGWELKGQPIQLVVDNKILPENAFTLGWNAEKSLYQLYLQQLSLDFPMLKLPQGLANHGELSDLQVHLTPDKTLQYLLATFSNLEYKPSKALPTLENISGVLHWQPDEGRLELDSTEAFLRFHAQDKYPVETLNGSFEWKNLGHGFKYNLDRLVVKSPNLVLTARGNLDNVGENAQQINLSAELSMNEVQSWLKRIPDNNYLKPKFLHWLKKDIKKVDKLVAELSLHGMTKDFPFDKEPGEFTVKAYINGADLAFAPHWPLIKNLDLWLTINKRELMADILQVDLMKLHGEKANLVVKSLGSDKEVLLMHGQLKAPANNFLEFLLHTPMRSKLKALDLLSVKEDVEVDLQLEVPLFPDSPPIAAQSDIRFQGNVLGIKHPLTGIEFKNLTGLLRLNEQGVVDSQLEALLLDHPVMLSLFTLKNPARTVVKVLGSTSIEALAAVLNVNWLTFMKGNFDLESVYTLTDDPDDLDKLQFHTTLKGVSITLPPPFAKLQNVETPLDLSLGYNAQKGLELRVNFAERMRAWLWFSSSKGLKFKTGQLILGSEKMTKSKNGFQILGNLEDFDLNSWQKALDGIPEFHSQNPSALNFLQLKIKKAHLFGQTYNNLSFRAQKKTSENWLMGLIQKNLAAELEYNTASKQLKGVFHKLALPKYLMLNQGLVSGLKPDSLPDLELHIRDLSYGTIHLGEAFIKTRADKERLKVEEARLQTPFYQLNLTGEWLKTAVKDATSVNGLLTVSNFSKSLEQWSFSPVVEARQGTVQLIGGWPGGFQNFSLRNGSGELAIVLKNGRISQFSQETEEKLGLGKLLSILSLQTIPRRLQLDFSDLSHKGYSFDIFKGNFAINKGMMTTKNSYIDGPIAFASMKGSLDIVRQVYDLDLRVMPHIEASLPIVATIAGGPIAGIATWVIGKIIHQGMQKVSGYTYKISGPWKQPLVQQVIIVKHK